MPFECEICHKQLFTKTKYLKQHLRTHAGEKPFECEICNAKFTRKCNLSAHLRLHTGDKPYKCEICNKQYIRSSDLKQHSLIHTGEKPHECEICNTKYLHKSSLQAHLLKHTGEKPFECEICNTKFGRKSYLRTHLHFHTGEKPIKCQICNKKFANRSNYSHHLRRLHPGEQPIKNDILKKKSPSASQRNQSDLSDCLKQHTDEGESCNLKINSENILKLEDDIRDMSDALDSMQPDIKLELLHEDITIEEINSEIESHIDDDESFILKFNSDSKLNLQEDMSDVRLNDSMQPDIKLELLHEELDIKLEEFSSDDD